MSETNEIKMSYEGGLNAKNQINSPNHQRLKTINGDQDSVYCEKLTEI